MAAGLALMMAGKAVQGYMQMQSLFDKAESITEMAASDLMQSQEIRRRADINKAAYGKQAQQLLAEQQGTYAGAGVDVSAGAPLSVMSDTMNTIVEKMNQFERETSYSLMIKEQEIENKFRQAEKITKAAPLAFIGSLAGGAGSIAAGG